MTEKLPASFELEQSGPTITARLHQSQVSYLTMQEVVNECLERTRYHNARHVILDLAAVEFLASACIGSLVSLLQDLEHICGRMAVVHCRDNVAFLFRVTRLDSVINLCEDEHEARKHLHA